MLIYTGASVKVVDEATFARFSPKPKLTRTNTRLVGYGSRRHIPHLGQFEATLETDSLIYVDTIHVVKGASGCLLRYATALQLGLVKVINHVDSEEIIKQYPALFDGSIGALKDYKVKLHIDTSVQPVAQPHRRIPFHVRKKVEDKLVELENADIIEKVDGPTPWISPIVTPPKPGNPDEIRLCVDTRGPNTAIKRERHITPPIEHVISDLNGARVFSKLDLNQGYHQIMLDESSLYITTFSTHVGQRRYKRLNFGICCASEIFQNVVRESLDGLPGVMNVSDDILINGCNHTEHDKRIHAALYTTPPGERTNTKQTKVYLRSTDSEIYGLRILQQGNIARSK